MWDPSPTPGVTYRVYSSTGTAPFSPIMDLTGTTATVAGISTSAPTRLYVTARLAELESVPSNTVTNTPTVTPPPLLGLSFEAESGAITPPFYVAGGTVQQDIQTGVNTGGRASYVFTVTNAGAYNVTVLVTAKDAASDSMYVNIDQEPSDPANVWHIEPTVFPEYRVVNWNFATNATAFSLGTGPHTLIIRGREAGVKFDRITVVPVQVAPPPQPPQPPTNLRANAVSTSRIDVSWTLAAPEIVKIQRSRDNVLWAEVATVAPGNSYYIDGGLQRGKVYYYRARTFNAVGFSTFSNVAFDRTLKH